MPGNALTSRLLLTVCAPALALLMLALLVICVLMPGSETARAQGSPEKDRQLLSGLYLALGGPGWTNSDNWLGDKPLGQWHGVTTDAQGRVTGLDLSGNGLTGAIPPGLSVLFDPSAFDIRLKELDLSDNGLSGQLPLGFVPLFPHLEVLKASGNQFRGPIPSDVSSLSKLTWLDLDNNHLSGRIPAGLGSLSNLTVLRLGGNDFSGPIPAELGQLSKLSILGLGNNRLSGRMPAELGRLASLTRLSVWGNELEGPIPSELGRLSKLTKLSLGNNSLSGDVPEQLGNLGKLEELSLSGNPGLTGCAPDGLKGRLDMSRSNLGGLPFCSEVGAAIDRAALEAFYHATRGASWKNKTNWLNDDAPLSSWHGVTTDSDGRVTRLVLFDNNLSGEIPAELGNLLNLKELRLENNSLKGGIPTELGYLVNLQWLWLQGNQLSGEIPGILGSLVKMDGMGLANNQLKGEIPAEFGNLVNLKELYLQGNQLSGEIPAELGDLAKLQWLYLYENQLRGEVPEELGKLANLVELKFGDNQLSGEIPPELGDLVNLEWLGLLNNQLSGEIPAELGKLTNLVTLYLEGNRLSGCLPRVLLKYQLNTNLSRLGGLPFCGDAPMLFSDWHLIGSASRTESGSALLTPAKTWQLGGILYPQPISAEDFTIRFSFEITGTEIRADGIVLTVAQDFPDDERINQARAGGRFGLEMFTRGIAVEFDSFNNSWETSANHVAVSRMGKEITDRPVHLASTDLDVDLRNSGVYEAEVVFDNGRFEVFLSNLDQGMEKTLLLEYTVPELAPYDEFYLGLLASTGGDTDRHIIHNVYLSQGEGPVVPAPTPTPPTPTPTPPPGVGQEADRAVLEALYNATGGANWRRKANWLDDDAPLSKWQGVTTDSGGRVTELRLSENELKGELPAELGNLDNLRFLNLQGNQLGNIAGMGHPGGSLLSSGIPAELGNLSSLVTLNLRDNNLSGKDTGES